MPQQAPVRVRALQPRGSEGRSLRQEYNKLVRKVRELCALLDADAGVAGTTYLTTFDAADGPREVRISENAAD